ncbi:MAG: peroxidase-related enzyme [Myxococcales bacterium]|nr:peroxidase-related enzyme [Myxococcales bacterium]
MSWIETVAPEHADGPLARLYAQVRSASGHVDNILKVHSLRPATLAGHLALYKAALHRQPCGLSPRERELVGVCVSLHNGCDYCVEHHRAGLARHLGGDASLAAALSQASRTGGPPLSDRERALCQYAGKLTRAPAEMRAADLEPLRAAGLDDAAILDLNQIVAYFAYANRTVLGLGVATAGEPLGLHPSEGSPGYQHQ